MKAGKEVLAEVVLESMRLFVTVDPDLELGFSGGDKNRMFSQ